MKKSRMLLLFGGLFLMHVGYVAWCGRTFYLRAPMPDLARVPAEARSLALTEIEELRRPQRITMKRLSELLMQPYDSEVPGIWIENLNEHLLFLTREDLSAGVTLSLESKGWERVAP